MRNCFILSIVAVLILMAAMASAVVAQPVVPMQGNQFTLNGQTFTVTTNASGALTFTSSGTNGTVSYTPPISSQQLVTQAEGMVAANNPNEIGFYGTNDLEVSLGAAYIQDDGKSVIALGATKYGLIKSHPQIGVDVAVYQGNNNGVASTAGATGGIMYRKPIGNVAISGGVMGGYDNWNSKPIAGVKGDIEYRQNAHLGEYAGAAYVYEPGDINGTHSGFIVGGGVRYSF